jgi:hypothetical protein
MKFWTMGTSFYLTTATSHFLSPRFTHKTSICSEYCLCKMWCVFVNQRKTFHYTHWAIQSPLPNNMQIKHFQASVVSNVSTSTDLQMMWQKILWLPKSSTVLGKSNIILNTVFTCWRLTVIIKRRRFTSAILLSWNQSLNQLLQHLKTWNPYQTQLYMFILC